MVCVLSLDKRCFVSLNPNLLFTGLCFIVAGQKMFCPYVGFRSHSRSVLKLLQKQNAALHWLVCCRGTKDALSLRLLSLSCSLCPQAAPAKTKCLLSVGFYDVCSLKNASIKLKFLSFQKKTRLVPNNN